MHRYINKYIGVASIICGILILICPRYYDPFYGVIIDFTNVRWPFSIVLLMSGIYILIVTSRKSAANYRIDIYICPKCEEPSKFLENDEPHLCTNCNVELEKLRNFYERHPELKEKKGEKQ